MKNIKCHVVKLGSPLLKAAALHIHFKKHGLSLKISTFTYLRLYNCASGKKIGKTYMAKAHERRRMNRNMDGHGSYIQCYIII